MKCRDADCVGKELMKSFPELAKLPIFSAFLRLGALSLVSNIALQAQSNYATPYAFTTLAGTVGVAGSQDSSDSLFYNPIGAGVDAAGNIYVADYNNETIRKITPAGRVTTLAGFPGSYGSANGSGAAARFWAPNGPAVDASGNLYVGNAGDHTIRKITPAAVILRIVLLPESAT